VERPAPPRESFPPRLQQPQERPTPPSARPDNRQERPTPPTIRPTPGDLEREYRARERSVPRENPSPPPSARPTPPRQERQNEKAQERPKEKSQEPEKEKPRTQRENDRPPGRR
jgi:hypothetical protein